VEVFGISVDSPEDSRALRRRLGLEFPLLSDAGRELIDLMQIRYRRLNPSGGDIAIPTVVYADRDGIIRWVFQTDDYRVRPRPEEILRIIAGRN